MSAIYGACRTAAGTALTIGVVASTANCRPTFHQIIISSDSTPADVATKFNLLRHTVAATGGTAITTRRADNDGTIGLCPLTQGTMTEPTYDSTALLEISLNQRATFTWIANPGREIKAQLGTANGLGLRSVASGGTPNINLTLAWDE